MFHLTTELDNKVADFHVESICLLPAHGEGQLELELLLSVGLRPAHKKITQSEILWTCHSNIPTTQLTLSSTLPVKLADGSRTIPNRK